MCPDDCPPFEDTDTVCHDQPGEKWYRLFLHWFPNLALQQAQLLSKLRAGVSHKATNQWFDELWEYLFETTNMDILEQPNRIYDCDETGFPMALHPTKVITSKGDPHIYQQGASTKAQITVLLTASATAHYVPPLMVLPGQNFCTTFVEEFYNIFPDAVFGHSTSGWVDQDLFLNWQEQSFITEIEKCHVPKPVLLLIDGAKVHISLFISELCDKHNVILYTYLPKSTHLLQALGPELMGSVKTMYRQEVWEWMSNNIEKSYDKLSFTQVFQIVFDKCSTVSNAIEGFKKSGVFPQNPSIIDDKKLVPSTMFEKNTELPDVNSSINKGVPASGEKGNEDDVKKVTETVAKVHSEPLKVKDPKGMAATIWPNGLLNEIIIDGVHI